jgi:hypothetical protein
MLFQTTSPTAVSCRLAERLSEPRAKSRVEAAANDNDQPRRTNGEAAVWDSEGPAHSSYWSDGEMAYSLTTLPGRKSGLELADLIRMAENLRQARRLLVG